VLSISPFNYPVWLSIGPIVCPFPFWLTLALSSLSFFKIGAIAAGNCVVLKPSELVPAVSALIAELIPKYMDSDVIRVVLGAVPETTKVCYSLLLRMNWVLSKVTQLLEYQWGHGAFHVSF
jgi:aldehyde dehydrogenase (NAD+)